MRSRQRRKLQGANEKMAGKQSVKATESDASTIVPFPVARRLTAIRTAAVELEDLHGAEALQFWRRRCRALADELCQNPAPAMAAMKRTVQGASGIDFPALLKQLQGRA